MKRTLSTIKLNKGKKTDKIFHTLAVVVVRSVHERERERERKRER